jgi:pimeloyl-ACP methyl ester carboxylesterase
MLARAGLAGALIWFAAGAASAAPPPAAAFGRLPEADELAISPDGSRIAMLGGSGDHRTITIAPVDGEKSVVLDVGKAEVERLRWAGTYLLATTLILDRSLQGGRYTYHMARDFVVSPEGKVLTYLMKDNPESALTTGLPILRIGHDAKPWAVVLGYDVNPNFLDMQKGDTHLRPNEDRFIPALWRVDIQTGEGRVIEKGDKFTEGWAVDLAGQPRVRVDHNTGTGAYFVMGRSKSAAGGWKVLAKGVGRRGGPPDVLGYSDAEDAVYLLQSGEDGSDQIVRRSLADGAATAVPFPAGLKEASIRFDGFTLQPIAVEGEAGAPVVEWKDPGLEALSAQLGRAFPGKRTRFLGWSQDRTRFLVSAEASDSAPVYYFLDAAKGQLSVVGKAYPELDGVPLGKARWLTYKARDGLEIPAYLTLPPGAPETGGRLPLIVFPHGGPAERDRADFDWWLQFMATRGYAVLQPQFRGSSGFGDAFEKAGRKEWAGKMQTDLLDGIQALAAQGVIDPARVCIVGGSYGGYAALAGAAFHPEAYKCAVSVNGISDLARLQGEEIRAYGKDEPSINYLRDLVGSDSGEAGFVAATSPIRHVDDVRAPVLLIAASDDTTVPYEQSAKMRLALEKAGKPVEMVTLDGDDHYLSSSASRTRMLESLERFLAAHLPAN